MSETVYYEPLAVRITEREEGLTVRTALERRLGVSRKLLSRLKLTEEGITLNGRRVYTNERVHAGDLLAVRMEQERSDDILPQPMPLDIVYEDRDLLVVGKPPGMVVHPTHGHYTHTLANGVVWHWRERGETVRFRPVHRLDEDTSGLVAVAKNPYVHQQLSEQHRDGGMDKVYIAFVYGCPPAESGTVDEPIDRNPEAPHIRIVTPDGYPSVTHYTLAERYGSRAASKVKLRLETGRTHQIRVHMKHIGCPLIGDAMYGFASDPAACGPLAPELEAAASRQALHAAELGLTHPVTRERMRFTASLPPDLQTLEAKLRELPKKI
ncbi:RluA family pseudouridine synthase [Paenibacillus humicola]|uniref:RluA family pseudouridine synthase n=1 Tax=Paenibacillus humicola TaxID=3110540 RepID=UPI00237BB24F|nr:RluA family pseudouridine synthase [Paenibacillus humicola]